MDEDNYNPNLNAGRVKPLFEPHINELVKDLGERREWQEEISKPFKTEILELETKLLEVKNRLEEATKPNVKRMDEIQNALYLMFQDPESLDLPLNPDRKEYNTPYGTVRFRRKARVLEIEDMDAALEWAKTNFPDAVKTTRTVIKSKIKGRFVDERFVSEQGEILDTPFRLSAPSNSVKVEQ